MSSAIPSNLMTLAPVLQEGIRKALVDEAMQWTGDARVEVWMALIDAGKRMGIVITKDELYRMQIDRQVTRENTPISGGTSAA